LVRVGWRTPPENIRSQKAAEKLGFAREGIMRYVMRFARIFRIQRF
jgi:RimJ/RimL family protein N-acetyltransferase